MIKNHKKQNKGFYLFKFQILHLVVLKIHIYKNIIKNIIILNIIIKINIKNIILLNIIKYYYNAGYHSNENDKNSATSIVF